MKAKDLKLGKLYWFPTRIKSCFHPDSQPVYLMQEKTVFVVLENLSHEFGWHDISTLKILTPSGEIWYTDMNHDDFQFMEQCQP